MLGGLGFKMTGRGSESAETIQFFHVEHAYEQSKPFFKQMELWRKRLRA